MLPPKYLKWFLRLLITGYLFFLFTNIPFQSIKLSVIIFLTQQVGMMLILYTLVADFGELIYDIKTHNQGEINNE